MAGTINCPVCGAENIAGSWFCKNCGALFDVSTTAPPKAVAPAAPTAPAVPTATVPEGIATPLADVAQAGTASSSSGANRFAGQPQPVQAADTISANAASAGVSDFIGNDYMEKNYQGINLPAGTAYSSAAAVKNPVFSSRKILVVIAIIVGAIVVIAIIATLATQAQYSSYPQNTSVNESDYGYLVEEDNTGGGEMNAPSYPDTETAYTDLVDDVEPQEEETPEGEGQDPEDPFFPYAGDIFVTNVSDLGIFIRSDHVVNGDGRYLNDGNKIGWISKGDTSVELVATGREYHEGGDRHWWYEVEIPQWYRDTPKQQENYAGKPLIGWVRDDVVRLK